MEDFNHPESNENFLKEPSKVVDLLQFMDLMVNANKMEDKREGKKIVQQPVVDPSDNVTDENFYISSRGGQRMGRRSTRKTRSKIQSATNTNQFTFMRQIEQTQEQRVVARKERERVALNFRRLGNVSYRKDQFNHAIEMYTKGLEYIKDTPVLYINRACCYIKLRNFKMAIIECNHILTKLDPRYLRAFLYRALAYKRMGDEKNFEQSINEAKQVNTRSLEFIDSFLDKMRTAY
ncbi:tetratricopeptide repeat protein 12 isoform X1 [Drosophila nasuta]|uniref:tetratricopeptide repeat protein 12 isoform X1 n=1 Tax=Drosophila nasuta TaxID=42062 RepID=UPI00295E61F3|nr:tetratricopeptide repeat protein 12 isoform X1 [Drosophila nasuta]